MILAKGYPESEAFLWWLYDTFWAGPWWAPTLPALFAWPLLVLALCGVVVTVNSFVRR